tara:strand:- start:3934 stop:4287 length:354 start_codon:yes stop_codon:yes gene_type:complete
MDPQFYKLLHLIGIMSLFTGLGALFLMGKNGQGKKQALMFHGIGLLLILVSGFGLLAKGGIPFNGAIITKLLIWLAMGAMVVVAKKGLLKGPVGWIVVVALGALSAYMASTLPATPW